MDLVGAKEASCSSSSWKPSNYHVFLSFRGEDTRNTFIAHLYTTLSSAGFRTFKDDDSIRRGENISSELEKGILKEARSSIVVFSKNYASSKWCLDELVMILQRNTTSGHKILPIFYHVDPSHVRNQTGCFAEAFCRHEERIKMEMNETKREHLKSKLKGWREALKQVGGLAGMVLAGGNDESKFIQEIVKEIGKNANRRFLYVGPYIVGMESRVKNITSWLEDDSDDVGILVIYGIGGVGKTTIAKYVYNVYNLNSERFEACSFLANVREKSKQPNGLVKLQEQLLSDISGREEKIKHVDEGIIRIEEVISCKKVLILIDGVEEIKELNAIIALRAYFHPKSKIILTTRRQDLLKANGSYKTHEVQRLHDDESLKLFSWHAFGQDHPIEGYIDHSKEVVECCGGIPLALQALGSSLGTNSKGWERSWESTLQKLKAIPNQEIQECLKISYEALPDDNVKNMFLHIACFFIGKYAERFTVRILDACGFYTQDGMKILINRSLLNIDEDNKLTMHQLLRDMGREIVRQESPDELGQRSRLWCHKDSFKVLKDKIGTEKIKGLLLNMHLMEKDKCSDRSFRARNTKRKRFEELGDSSSLVGQGNSWKRLCLGLLSWFPINMAIRNSDQEELKAVAFARMRNLALLQLNYVEIKGKYKEFPKELRWLCWHGFSLESLPSDFPVDSLVVLDLRYSSLKQLWKGTKMLNELKILNLSHCQVLDNSPNFSQLPSLEELILKDCIKLVGLDKSIEKLEKLLLLNLKGCKTLRQLPRGIFEMKSIIVMILSGCSTLHGLPPDFGKMESLRVLHADGINQSYSISGEVKPWHKCIWSRESKLTSPESFHFSLTSLPRFIVSLSLVECNLFSDRIPGNLFTMCTLQKLNLSKNPIRSLPELPLSLRCLDVTNCSSLEMLTNLPNLSSELLFFSTGCEKLVEIQGLYKLAPVRSIDSEMVEELGLDDRNSNRMLQVQLMNQLTHTNQHKAPVLQGLYECGIYSIFLRSWSVIPDWFDQKSKGRHLSFTVPSSQPNLKIRGLNVCVVFESYNKPFREAHTDYIVVNNKTRNLTALYTPLFKSCDVGDEDLMWLNNWKIANQLMGAGDKVDVWIINLGQQKVKEFGIRIVYDDNPTTCSQDVHFELSDYEMKKNAYVMRLGSQFEDDNPTTSHQDVDLESSDYKITKDAYLLRTDSLFEGDSFLEKWMEPRDSEKGQTGGISIRSFNKSLFDFVEYVDDVEEAYNSDDCAFLKQLGLALENHIQGRLARLYVAGDMIQTYK